MSLTTWIAFRYLKSKGAGRFSLLLVVTAVSAIAIAIFALTFIMSIMNGFRQEVSSKLIHFNSHIVITGESSDGSVFGENEIRKILDKFGVKSVAPSVEGEAIATSSVSADESALGVMVRGIEFDRAGVLAGADFYFPDGIAPSEFSGNAPAEGNSLRPVILGEEAAKTLSVHPDFADDVTLIAPLADVMPNGEMGPNKRKFKIAGVFKTGIMDYDSKCVLMPLGAARDLMGMQARTGWQIELNNIDDVDAAIRYAKNNLPAGISIEGWHTQNRKLFRALALERVAMGFVLGLVLLIASFAILGVVMLVAAAKRKDVAIFSAIGADSRQIAQIFALYAAFIGAAGSVAGFVAAIITSMVLKIWPLKLPEAYYLDRLPVDINLFTAFIFAVCGVGIAVIAALYPAMQAASLKPAEVLRYE